MSCWRLLLQRDQGKYATNMKINKRKIDAELPHRDNLTNEEIKEGLSTAKK